MTEPWIITCETCQTKLRVRSAEAVGSILACPKCHSLVQIGPPPAPVATTGRLVSTTESTDAHVVPPGRASARIAIVGTCAMAVAVIGLVVAWRAMSQNRSAAASQARADKSHEAASSDATLAAAADVPSSAENSHAAAPEVRVADEPPVASADDPSVGEADATTPRAAPPALPESPADVQFTPPSDATDSPPRTARRVPPVGIAQFDLDLTRDELLVRPPAPAESAPRVDAAAPDQEAESQSPAPSAVDSAASPPAAPPASTVVRMNIERVAENGQSLPGVDPDRALSLPMAGLVLEGASPLEIVRLLADLTGARISVTPEAYLALEHASVSGLTGRHEQTTAGEVLDEILRQHSLKAERHEEDLVVTVQAPTDVSRQDMELQTTPADDALLVERLEQRITYSFTQPTPLAHVLRHIERTSGVVVLADWKSLAEIELSPASAITSSVVDQPLSEVLDGLMPQLNLQWRTVGQSAIWLSTRKP